MEGRQMITGTSLMIQAAHLLWTFALVAASLAALGGILLYLGSGRGGARQRAAFLCGARRSASTPAPARRARSVVSEGRLTPRHTAAPCRHASHQGRNVVTATVPAIAPRSIGAADELAALHGVAGLAARARASRWQRAARQVAALHMASLTDDPSQYAERRVELDLELAGQVVMATLLTTSGVFVVMVYDRDPNDAGSVLTMGPSVERHARAASALARLTGVEPEILLYSPYITAPARNAYIGRPVLTVGGPAALEELLSIRRGSGPPSDALAQLYDADKSPAFVACLGASSRMRSARLAAAEQIEPLATAGRVVELDLTLGGQTITAALITTSGIFLVAVCDQETADLATFLTLGQHVTRHAPAVAEVARLTGLTPDLVAYSPYRDEAARSDYARGPVLTVGCAAALEALLEERSGQGLTREALARFRDAAKPLGRMSGDDLPLRAGWDTPAIS